MVLLKNHKQIQIQNILSALLIRQTILVAYSTPFDYVSNFDFLEFPSSIQK